LYKKLYLIIFFYLISVIHGNSKEIQIVSDLLEIDREKRTSVFSGSVYVLEEEMEIWAEKITVIFNDNDNQIKEFFLEDNVKIVRLNMTATGESGFYSPISDTIEMFNEVKIVENGNFVKCDELFLDIKNSVSIMKSDNRNRVEALIVN